MYVKLVIVAGVVGDEAMETKMEPTVREYSLFPARKEMHI